MLLAALPYLLYAFIFWGGYRLLRRQVYARGGELPYMHPAAFLERYYEPVGGPVTTTPMQRLQRWIKESEEAEKTEDSPKPSLAPSGRGVKSCKLEGKTTSNLAPSGRDVNPSGMDIPGRELVKTDDYPDKVLVCLGDSITHGRCSDDYVHRVRQNMPPGWEVINAGINGDTAWNMLQRLDSVIACQPDAVTILAGTNDINADQSASMQASYRRSKAIPAEVALDRHGYLNAMRTILSRLREETDAKIAVFTIPMIGEDGKDAMNAKVAVYNDALRSLCQELQITVLELNEAQQRLIETMHSGESHPDDENLRAVINTRPGSFGVLTGYDVNRVEREIKRAPYRRFVLMQSWTDIADAYGYYTLIDGMHLNDRGGCMASCLLMRWLSSNKIFLIQR